MPRAQNILGLKVETRFFRYIHIFPFSCVFSIIHTYLFSFFLFSSQFLFFVSLSLSLPHLFWLSYPVVEKIYPDTVASSPHMSILWQNFSLNIQHVQVWLWPVATMWYSFFCCCFFHFSFFGLYLVLVFFSFFVNGIIARLLACCKHIIHLTLLKLVELEFEAVRPTPSSPHGLCFCSSGETRKLITDA